MRKFYKILTVVMIIGMGVIISVILTKSKPNAVKKSVAIAPPAVESIIARETERIIILSSFGTVIPDRKVTLKPQVSGNIIWKNKGLIPGLLLQRNETIIRIDPSDYILVLRQREANLKTAEVDLKIENRRRAVAEREWQLIEKGIETTEKGRELALRKPQEELAKVKMNSALSSLKKAELDLSRTVINAPFKSIVIDEEVETGQNIGPGQKIATLVSTDKFRIQASIPEKDLHWINIPGINSMGSKVKVISNNSIRKGEVISLCKEVDTKGRMANIIIRVNDPLDIKAGESPLLLGTYVRLEIQGKKIKGIYSIPQKAIRENNAIWVIKKDKLTIRNINVVWESAEEVLIRGDIKPGEKIIISRISMPVEGMKIKEYKKNL